MSGFNAILQFESASETLLDAFAKMESHTAPQSASRVFAFDASLRAINAELVRDCPGDGVGALVGADCGVICSPARNCWAVFDGEIYNAPQLQSLVEAVHSATLDAELAALLYDKFEERTLEMMDGVWAALFVDARRNHIVVARDRLGKVPLFYCLDGGRLLLSTNARNVANARGAGPEQNKAQFRQFLAGLPPRSAGETFYHDVHVVPAGSYFVVNRSEKCRQPIVFRKYWDLGRAHLQSGISYDAAQDCFLELLKESLRKRAGEAEVGCLLSGGLDSSLLAILAAERCTAAPLHVFSVVYDDVAMTEESYIDAVVRHCGLLDAHKMKLTPAAIWDAIDPVVRSRGEPLLGLDVIAQAKALQFVAGNRCRVVLDGEGPDELFGGTAMSAFAIVRERICRLQLLKLAAELRRSASSSSLTAMIRRTLLLPVKREVMSRQGGRRYPWLRRGHVSPQALAPPPQLDGFRRAVWSQLREQNVPTVLAHTHANATAAGVVVRMPYLDYHLVEFCFSLPMDYCATVGSPKRVLCSVARKFLPPAVVNRPDKQGMIKSALWASLLRNHPDALHEMTRSSVLCSHEAIDAPLMRRFVENYLQRKHEDALAVWRLFTAWRWLEFLRAPAGAQ